MLAQVQKRTHSHVQRMPEEQPSPLPGGFASESGLSPQLKARLPSTGVRPEREGKGDSGSQGEPSRDTDVTLGGQAAYPGLQAVLELKGAWKPSGRGKTKSCGEQPREPPSLLSSCPSWPSQAAHKHGLVFC